MNILYYLSIIGFYCENCVALFCVSDSQVAMEAKATVFDVHAHKDSGESYIEPGHGAASAS